MSKRKYVQLNIENIESDIANAYALGYTEKADALRSYFDCWLNKDRLTKKIAESRRFAANHS